MLKWIMQGWQSVAQVSDLREPWPLDPDDLRLEERSLEPIDSYMKSRFVDASSCLNVSTTQVWQRKTRFGGEVELFELLLPLVCDNAEVHAYEVWDPLSTGYGRGFAHVEVSDLGSDKVQYWLTLCLSRGQ